MSPATFYVIIFLACCLGHAMIWVRTINWTHGLRTQKQWTDIIRLGMQLILIGLPILWLVMTEFSIPNEQWDGWPMPIGWLVLAYVILTGIMGLFVFPYIWITYLFRKTPPALMQMNSDIHDIGRSLGRRPVGIGRRGWMAHLPFNQAFELEMNEKELSLPRLPAALDGLRLLHLSDLHFIGRPAKAYFERVFHLCAHRPCDILVLTGDLVDSEKHYEWLRLLKMIKPSLCTLAIRGNHDARYDYEKVNSLLAEFGFNVLGGQSKIITVKGEPVLVAGNEAPWLLPVPDLSSHQDQNCFRLGLIHTPDQFQWAVQQRFDLVLAGHNHGGQIRLPGFGSIFVPSKTGRRYDMGLHQQGSTVLHVSRGLSGGHPVRYFCRPEATWLVLRSTKG